jgi:hypothetical protein
VNSDDTGVVVSKHIHAPAVHLPQPNGVTVGFALSFEMLLGRNMFTEIEVAQDVWWIVVRECLEPIDREFIWRFGKLARTDDANAFTIVIDAVVLVDEANMIYELACVKPDVEEHVSMCISVDV